MCRIPVWLEIKNYLKVSLTAIKCLLIIFIQINISSNHIKDASVHSGNLDHKIKLESYSRFMTGYFLVITLILILTLIIFFTHWITNKLRKGEKTFLDKLGEPLIEETQLEEDNLKRIILDRMYIDVIAINEIMDSNELYTHLNLFNIRIVNEEYQLMRLKYRRLKNKIEDKILKFDGHFQTNRSSIAQLNLDLTNHRIVRALQKEIQLNSKFNQQIKSHFNAQAHLSQKSDKLINLENNSNWKNAHNNDLRPYFLPNHNPNRTQSNLNQNVNINLNKKVTDSNLTSNVSNFFFEFIPKKVFHNEVDLLPKSNRHTGEEKLKVKQNLKPFLKIKDDYMFKYSLPNNLDLLVKKYNKCSFNGRLNK